MSSFRSGGVASTSIGVTKPYGYSRSVSARIVFSVVLMLPPDISAYTRFGSMAIKRVVFILAIETATYEQIGCAEAGCPDLDAWVLRGRLGSLVPVMSVGVVAVTVPVARRRIRVR